MIADVSRDPRRLLGMNEVSARWVALVFFCTYTFLVFSSPTGVHNLAVVEGAVVLVSLAAAALFAWPGDPLPMPVAATIAATGPVATSIVLWQLPIPVDNGLQTWPLGAGTALFTFICVRGRAATAWTAMTATVLVCVVWALATGQNAVVGLSMSVVNYAPLAMATFFAFTFRPVAAAVFELREQSRKRAAEDAATSAVLEERDSQLERLDFLARPLLMKIASGAELRPDERDACALLESALRDSLRAKGLESERVDSAARAARQRGVHVVLLDDGGLSPTDSAAAHRLRETVAAALDSAESGTVTARILPPGRPMLASILTTDSAGVRRLDIGSDGADGQVHA